MKKSLLHYEGVSYVLPFILITSCFALWGFANDITNPMVKAFAKIFLTSDTEGALVQVAFYGGYFAMAFPAAIFIRRYSYKSGVLVGLGMYAIGAFLFYPAMLMGSFYPFLVAYFILTCGLSFLETSCNPYILSMGSEDTATRRLNFAQCFNPCGSILGMFVAMQFIQNRLNPLDKEGRALLGHDEFVAMRDADLLVLIKPYLIIGLVILAMFVLILLVRMPRNGDGNTSIDFMPTLRRIFSLPRYRDGVIAQFFYVGAQIMCWTFIIHYGTHMLVGKTPTHLEDTILSLLGTESSGPLTEKAAEVISQGYNIMAMAIFIMSRFICTFLMKYMKPGLLLAILAVAAGCLTIGVMGCEDRTGIYWLVGVSACMSLMFPTIYGIALDGLGDDAKFGAAGLIMAILGGSVMPPLQAWIIDQKVMLGMPAVNVSFILPLVCFVVVAIYGYRTWRIYHE